MRGPRLKTPLLLLLLLLTSLTGTVLCDEGDGADLEPPEEEEVPGSGPEDVADTEAPAVSDSISATDQSLTDAADSDPVEENTEDHSSGDHSLETVSGIPDTTDYPSITDSTATNEEAEEAEEEEGGLSPIIILIPVVLVVVIIGMIVCGIFLSRRWNKKVRNQELSKEDPYLDGSSTEKVPMPMFEEDVPSVLELEMEELDQWMKKDSEAAEDSKQT